MIIRPEAEADLANARDWYEGQRAGLGAEFLLCVEEVLERIGRMPEMGHPFNAGHSVASSTYREGLITLTRPWQVIDL